MASSSASFQPTPQNETLPGSFSACMDDGKPVTSHNLLEYLAEYVEEEGMMNRLVEAAVIYFAGSTTFPDLENETVGENQVFQFVFAEENYSRKRMCFIVDFLLVKQIYIHLQCDYHLITSSVELSHYVDQEKVEMCMCLKKFMSLPLWQLIGAQALQHEVEYNFRHVVLFWTKQERQSLRRQVYGPQRLSFLNMLRSAWRMLSEKENEKIETSLDKLLPGAWAMWRPPHPYKETIAPN